MEFTSAILNFDKVEEPEFSYYSAINHILISNEKLFELPKSVNNVSESNFIFDKPNIIGDYKKESRVNYPVLIIKI